MVDGPLGPPNGLRITPGTDSATGRVGEVSGKVGDNFHDGSGTGSSALHRDQSPGMYQAPQAMGFGIQRRMAKVDGRDESYYQLASQPSEFDNRFAMAMN